MSHLEERSEKICLNCGTELIGRYCQKCGQENIEPKPSLGHLLKHFFNDVTHFDGRLFSTMKLLIIRPGFLSSEYLSGKRTSYLDPIRMFLFISATFFLLFVNPNNADEHKPTNKSKKVADAKAGISDANKELRKQNLDTLSLDTTEGMIVTDKGQKLNVSHPKSWKLQETTAAYDSSQMSLSPDKRDNWLEHYFKRRFIAAKELSHKNEEEFKRRFVEGAIHSAHLMLFFTLPLIAFILFLLYIRHDKFYYVSHLIFILHYYSVVFLSLVLIMLLNLIGGYADYAVTIIYIGCFIYPLIAMKRFYKQGKFKTFVKYILFLLIGSTVISILAVVAMLNSLLNVGV
jgi:hypothetical protein